MSRPHNDEAAIVAMAVTVVAMGLSFLLAAGYLTYRFWPNIVALFD